MFVALQNQRPPQQQQLPNLGVASSSSSSASSLLRGTKVVDAVDNGSSSGSGNTAVYVVPDDEDDPIMEGRSEVGGWSQHEQDQFISLILPYIHGKRLNREEVQLIRMEAQQAGLPPECVDRLIEENEEHYKKLKIQQKRAQSKHKKRDFDNIEEVDESDNIMAYFSRMATLKEGGHFPGLNTEAIGSFVEDDCGAEEVEVDLDVGYVNKSLNMPLDTSIIQQMKSWSDDDDASEVPLNMTAESNRYDPMGFNDAASSTVMEVEHPLDAFQSLLVGGASAERQDLEPANVSFDSGIMQTDDPGKGASKSGSSGDWDVSSTQTPTGLYGQALLLDEWKRKRTMALWRPESSAKALVSRGPFFACQTLALQAAADELSGLLFEQAPRRLHSVKAVQNMIASTKERRKRQQEMNLMRHVPDAVAAKPRPWQLPYRERCRNSPGYLGVDQYSLMDSAAALRVFDSRDVTPWETRDVRQHFLDEQSISLSRNWFGNLRRKRGNDKNKYKPVRPSSMPIPTEPSLHSASEEVDDWTEVLSKASKSWKKEDEVNQTASMSDSSVEEESQSSDTFDDETTSRFASRSERTYSVTFRSSVLTSSQSTAAKTDSSNADQISMATGTETSASTSTGTYSDSRYRSDGVQSMSIYDDVESTGVSAILDADEGEDDEAESTGISEILDNDDSSKASSVSRRRLTRDRYSSSENDEVSRSDHDDDRSRSSCSEESSGSYYTEDSESTSDGSWEEELPECGAFVNVKPKLGERVSRVTPDYTSHLLRSRFRKKYFPRGGISLMNATKKHKASKMEV